MLKVQNVHSFYGPIEALKGVDLQVDDHEIVTLIGANGAGKTTLLMTLCGQPRAKRGKIVFNDRDITDSNTHDIARLGLVQVPEGRRIFSKLTVFENLQLGGMYTAQQDFVEGLEKVYTWFPVLKDRCHQRAGTLSGGEQQMLAIGRALLQRPKMLLLDEPSLGLAPLMVKQIFKILNEINQEQRIPMLLVEQNAHHALRLAHRGYVLVNGRVTLSGACVDLVNNPEVKAAYLHGET